MKNLSVGLVLIVATAWLHAPALADDAEILPEDARVSGKQIHAFGDDGKNVMVVLGDFRLVLGQRIFTGRDAVIWIAERKSGDSTVRDFTVYIEGKAKAVEPGGASTTDNTLLVRFSQRGRVFTDGAFSDRPLEGFPLYTRAKEVRDGASSATQPARHEAPALAPATTQPAVAAAPTTAGGQTPLAAPTTKPVETPRPKEVLPVTWRADNIVAEQRGTRRVIVARGNVYLSQGNPEGAMFLELRSESAVLFTQKVPADKKSTSPLSTELGGVKTSLPAEKGAAAERETVTGVYLEGDVIIARGERFLRGPAAYYDFTTDRALIVEPVFRSVQKQRNIPIYVRAAEARVLSAREVWFRDAKITTSDFYTPEYHIGAKRAYLMDNTPYDEKGIRVGERSWLGTLEHTTFNIRGLPVLYAPILKGDFTEGDTSLRKIQAGKHGRFGLGVETEWHLFRLLGLLRPEGYTARLELDYYERGVLAGVKLDYARPNYSGYSRIYGLYDRKAEDDFGQERENIPAPQTRGRFLARHKQLLPKDWLLQLELSYLCDKNFLEEFFPEEFHAGKEQETLAYLKKQQDNWAFDALLQYRLNRFQTQTESAPDLGFYLIGEPLGRVASLYSESHAGLKRYRPASDAGQTDSRLFPRADTRNEVQVPLHAGPANLVAYATGRATYWDDTINDDGERCRPYGQIGLRANTHLWRVYNDVANRLWDLNRLRHVVTPEAAVFLADNGGVHPSELFPMDPFIEQHLTRTSGAAFGVRQRLQTKRGAPGNQRTVDWMRLDVMAGFYTNGDESLPADGRFFGYRPEYSLARNHVNVDYAWNISDSTTFLADTNYDTNTGSFRRTNFGLAVQRDPRLRYYAGLRYLRDLDSSVGTFGFNYKLSTKYSLSVLEQYDFDYNGSENLITAVTITRKFPRWFAAFSFTYNRADDDIGLLITFWPEGVPEFKLGGGRMSLLGRSGMN
ncbi:MAG TPA: hypothetical protein DCX07_00715 [Phycisphaerales bacterium]|nr:hypothetical protein [Phycisphaerales bacterium]